MRVLLKNANIVVPKREGYDLIKQNVSIEEGHITRQTDMSVYDEEIDCSDKTIYPALFNIHCHLGESVFKDISGNDWDILKYLAYTETHNKKLTEQERKIEWSESAIFTIDELAKTDTVGLCASRSAEICRKFSFCNMSGFPIMNSEKVIEFKKSGLEGFLDYKSEFQSDDCCVGVFLHSLYFNDRESLRLASQAMRCGGEFITVHVSEDSQTYELEKNRFDKKPVFLLDEYGLLSEKTILVHCGYASDDELRLIKKRNAAIAVCPISNHFLNTKIIDVDLLNKSGIDWMIATDGLATGRTFDLMAQAKYLKRFFPDLSYEELFFRMTKLPARFFNRSSYTGAIEENTVAKFIVRPFDGGNPIERLFEEKADFSL
ncbi:MAG: amidohydrolase family protein [Clostridia bacterium]|nr:amidohydrolase family protein [Clostridia bacterium]